MDDQSDADTSNYKTPPARGRATPLSQPPCKKIRQSRDTPSASRSRTAPSKTTGVARRRVSTSKPQKQTSSKTTPTKELSATLSSRSKPSLPRMKSSMISDSMVQATRKYPVIANVKQCPAGRTFVVPDQREKAYYQFVVCVADDKYANMKRQELTRDHARCFYCLSCDEEVPIIKGKSKVDPHMHKKHSDALKAFEEDVRREQR